MPAHGGDRLVRPQTVASQPGLEANVHDQVAQSAAGASPGPGIGGQAPGPQEVIPGRHRDPGSGSLAEAIRRDRKEHEDRRIQAGRAELERLVQRRDAEPMRSGSQRGMRDRNGPVAVSVGLHHGLEQCAGG